MKCSTFQSPIAVFCRHLCVYRTSHWFSLIRLDRFILPFAFEAIHSRNDVSHESIRLCFARSTNFRRIDSVSNEGTIQSEELSVSFRKQSRKPKFDASFLEENLRPYADEITAANQYEKFVRLVFAASTFIFSHSDWPTWFYRWRTIRMKSSWR